VGDNWREAAENAGATAGVMEILSSVADVHGLHPCARGASGEIGLGAAADAYAAVYVSVRGLTIALEPEIARSLADAFGLARLAKNPTTHYVKVPSDRFADPAVAARVRVDLERAVQRSWEGPRWQRKSEGGALAKLMATCPIHNYQLPVTGGWCMSCDGPAPTL